MRASVHPADGDRRSRWSAALVLGAAIAAVAAVSPSFLAQREPQPIHPGPGVTYRYMLSRHLPALAGTPGDTPVYCLAGRLAGGTALVLGGTHADEPAGHVAAVVLIERARVARGRLLVIPRANASGFTHTMPLEAHPPRFSLTTRGGARQFSFGARATNPLHQWPDPQVVELPGSGQTLSGVETRNLNRAYPGRPAGTLTERIAYAITSLITAEDVSIAFDLHEAAPEYPVVNTIVAHQRAGDLAALVTMNLDDDGVAISLEASPENLHGLSHREWGDATATLALLMETTNPSQGRLRGRTDAELVRTGSDRFYVLAAGRSQLSVPFDGGGWPLDVRVARHLTGLQRFLADLGELDPGATVVLRDVPGYRELVERGIGAFLDQEVECVP